MPVASDLSDANTNVSTNQDNVDTACLERIQTASAKHTVELNKAFTPLYDPVSLDASHNSAVFFPSSTQSPSGYVFQISASSQTSTATVSNHAARNSQAFDPRECARRRLVNSETSSEKLHLSSSSCSTPRKSESPTRKRPRTSSCNESHNTSMFTPTSNHPLDGRHIHCTVSAMKKRVLNTQSTSNDEVPRYNLLDGVSSSINSTDMEPCLSSNRVSGCGDLLESEPSLFSTFSISADDNISQIADISLQSRSATAASEQDISGSSQSDPTFSSSEAAVDSDSCSFSFSDFLSDEEIFGDSLPPSDVEMNDDELCEQTPPEYEVEALEEESSNSSSSQRRRPSFPHVASQPYPFQNNTSRRMQPGYVGMPTRIESNPQRPVVIGMDRRQYTSALSVPVTVPSMAFPVHTSTRTLPCPIPPRVVAFPTQSAPVLTTCTRPPVNMPQQFQVPPPLTYPDYRHMYPPSTLAHPQVPLSRQAQPPQAVSNNHHGVHHEQSYSQHMQSAMPSVPSAQRAGLYSLPTLGGAHHRSSTMMQPSPHQLMLAQNPAMRRLHGNNLCVGSTRQPGLPRSHASLGHAPFAPPNHLLSYGMATGGSPGEISSNHYIPSQRQPLPMQYHPSMHVEGSRSDPMDMSLGASSVPPGQPHHVAMPANFIPAAVPPLYRDYASVDPLNAQNSQRPAGGAPMPHSHLHSHSLFMPQWNLPAMAHPLPHLVAFHVPAFPGFMLNSYFNLRPYVSIEDEFDTTYETLLSLADRIGDAKPQGLSRNHIEQLDSYRYKPGTHSGDQPICVVCMCEWEPKQLLRVLPCKHEFHAKCVDRWLKRNRTCPICRGDAGQRSRSSTATHISRNNTANRRTVA